jgi:hypothetical protein
MQQDRREVLRALLAANGGKMLSKDASQRMQKLDILYLDSKNIDAIKVLACQLHALSDLKMIEETAKGWRWLG